MIIFYEKKDLGYSLETIMYAVELALAENRMLISDVDDYQLGLECMAACGCPEPDYNDIIEQMKELGFDFGDFDFDFDRSSYYRGFGCRALSELGRVARQVWCK